MRNAPAHAFSILCKGRKYILIYGLEAASATISEPMIACVSPLYGGFVALNQVYCRKKTEYYSPMILTSGNHKYKK